MNSYGFEDVGTSGISDDTSGDSVELTEGGTEFVVGSFISVDGSLGEDGVVFEFGSSDGWAVVGDEDESGLTLSEGSENVLVTDLVLTRLDDKLDLGVDVLLGVLLWHWR